MPFVLSAIAMILVAGMMRHIFAQAGITDIGKGLVNGGAIGLLFIAPWTMINNAYGMRPFRLTLIDGGYAIIGCAIIGTILVVVLKKGRARRIRPSLHPACNTHHTRLGIRS